MLSKAKAIAAYPGERAEAEAALALIFHSANKGLAHATASFKLHSGDARLLEIAFRGVPALLINGFYSPLGIIPHAINSLSAQEPVAGSRQSIEACASSALNND